MTNVLSRFVSGESPPQVLAIEAAGPSTSMDELTVRSPLTVATQNQMQTPQAYSFHGCTVSIINNNYNQIQ